MCQSSACVREHRHRGLTQMSTAVRRCAQDENSKLADVLNDRGAWGFHEGAAALSWAIRPLHRLYQHQYGIFLRLCRFLPAGYHLAHNSCMSLDQNDGSQEERIWQHKRRLQA